MLAQELVPKVAYCVSALLREFGRWIAIMGCGEARVLVDIPTGETLLCLSRSGINRVSARLSTAETAVITGCLEAAFIQTLKLRLGPITDDDLIDLNLVGREIHGPKDLLRLIKKAEEDMLTQPKSPGGLGWAFPANS